MGLHKGAKGNNPKGRPKGAGNKITLPMRERLQSLIDSNWDQLKLDLISLEPRDRLIILEKFISYTTPKLSAVDATVDLTARLNTLSNEQLEQIIQQVLINDNGKF